VALHRFGSNNPIGIVKILQNLSISRPHDDVGFGRCKAGFSRQLLIYLC
jgi:hypothetical protein